MKNIRNTAILLSILAIAYLAGPRYAKAPIVPQGLKESITPGNIEQYLQQKESTEAIKPGNQARIVWADSSHTPTEYAVVYMHGFSASQEEGNPVHTEFAKRYGCNLLLARLPYHGIIDTSAFLQISPDTLVDGALQALQAAKAIGRKIILMGCSTGGSLSIYLAAQYPDDIAGLILYSPNIEIASPAAPLLTMPWGREIAALVSGGDYYNWKGTPHQQKHWQTTYHIDGLLALQALVESIMTPEIFAKMKKPFFMGYYYQDEEHQDRTVSVPAMLRFFKQVGTSDSLKHKVNFPKANTHVIGYHETSGDIQGC